MHNHSRSTWACALVFIFLTLLLQTWPGLASTLLFQRPAFEAGAWWQLFTSQWVHLSVLHAVVNAAALAGLLWAFFGLVTLRLLLAAWASGYVGVAVVLALDPACSYYAGASGALHGLAAGTACAMVLHQGKGSPRTVRGLGGVLLLGLLVKLGFQHDGDGASGWLSFATYTPAHEAGALGGGLVVALLTLLRPTLHQPG